MDIIKLPNGADFELQKLINLLAGTDPTDGVNLQQLTDAIAGIAGGVVLKGGYDVSSNIPDLESPLPGAVSTGFLYIATTPGLFFTEPVEIGDSLISIVDNPSSLSDWLRIEKNKDTETLAETLAAGNTSGPNDILMDDTRKIQLGSNVNQNISNLNSNQTQASVWREFLIKIASSDDNTVWTFDDSALLAVDDNGSLQINHTQGEIISELSTGIFGQLKLWVGLTATREWVMPNKSGTVLVDSDLPTSLPPSGAAGGDLAGTFPSPDIGPNKVTNAKLAQIATAIFKGRTTAGVGNVEDLTAAEATAILNTFTAALQGLVPASGGSPLSFLRGDGIWAAPPASSGLFGSTVTPPQITADQNNYSPTGLAPGAFLRIDLDSDYDLSGIDSSGFSDRDIIGITNISSNKIKVLDNDASSTAVNRILLKGDLDIQENESAIFIRDTASSRWRLLANYNN